MTLDLNLVTRNCDKLFLITVNPTAVIGDKKDCSSGENNASPFYPCWLK